MDQASHALGWSHECWKYGWSSSVPCLLLSDLLIHQFSYFCSVQLRLWLRFCTQRQTLCFSFRLDGQADRMHLQKRLSWTLCHAHMCFALVIAKRSLLLSYRLVLSSPSLSDWWELDKGTRPRREDLCTLVSMHSQLHFQQLPSVLSILYHSPQALILHPLCLVCWVLVLSYS